MREDIPGTAAPTTDTPDRPAETDWLKAKPAARYCGGIGAKLLYTDVRAGRLKAARIGSGRNLLFHRRWLDEWLQQRAAGGVR